MDARSRYKARTSAAGVGTNESGITGPIKDVKAEEEAFEQSFASQPTFQEQKTSYISPRDTYASDLNFVTVDPQTTEKLGLFEQIGDKYAISDETLNFFGVDPANPGNIPQELYKLIAEGSLVTPMEVMQSGESGIGTYSDLEAGTHPLLGSLDKYYGIMSGSSFPQPSTGGGGVDFDIGGGGTYVAGIATGFLNQRTKKLYDDEDIPPQLRLLQYMVNVHRGNPYTKLAMRKKDGGLATIVGD